MALSEFYWQDIEHLSAMFVSREIERHPLHAWKPSFDRPVDSLSGKDNLMSKRERVGCEERGGGKHIVDKPLLECAASLLSSLDSAASEKAKEENETHTGNIIRPDKTLSRLHYLGKNKPVVLPLQWKMRISLIG